MNTRARRAEAVVNPLVQEIRHNPLLWLLILVPVVVAAQLLNPEAHTHIGQGRHSLIPLPRNRATPGAPARGPVHRPAQHDATEREGARNNCGIHGGHATAGRAGPRQLPAAPARPTTSPAGAQDSGGPSGGNSTAPSASTAWRLVRWSR